MRRRLVVPLILLLGFTIVHAQDKTRKESKKTRQSLLWRIQGKGLTHPCYVFGTIHMICADQYFWTDSMKAALFSSKQLCLELPMADTNMQENTMQALALPEGKTLADYFSDKDYERLSAILSDSLQMPIEAFEQFKPFLIYSLLTLKSAACDNPIAYENKLMAAVKDRQVPIIGLETLDQQLALFDQMPKDELSNMILKIADHIGESKQKYQQMVDKYTHQDLDGLYQILLETPDFAKFRDVLLDNRNKSWIPKMEKMMAETPTFFAVGAGHLPGESGVLHLLEAAGYQVTAVK